MPKIGKGQIHSIKKYESIIVFLFCALVSIFILRDLLFTQESIGFRHDWDFPTSTYQLKEYVTESFYMWNQHNLGSPGSYSAQFLFQYFLLPFSYLGFSGVIVIKLLLFLVLASSGYFMYLLLRRSFRLGFIPSLFSGIFYATTPVVFNRIVAGHIIYLVPYALSPLVMLFFKKYTDNYQTKYLVLTGLLVAAASIMIQFAVMLPLIVFLYSIFVPNTKLRTKLKQIVKIQIFLIAIVLLVHSFWIIPAINSYSSLQTTLTHASSAGDLESWSTSIINAVRLIGYRPDYILAAANNNQYSYVWAVCSVLLVILIFSSLLVRKHRVPLIFGIISIITLTFTIGLSGPFGWAVYSLYSNFPIFNVFREVYHLTFLTSFSFSIMLAYAIHSLLNLKKGKLWKTISAVLILFLVVFNNPFIYSGDFSGQVQQYELNKNDLSLMNEYQTSQELYRVLYLPMVQPFAYENLTFQGIDPVIRYSEKPTIGNYVNSEFARRTAVYLYMPSKNINPLLDLLGVKYVFFRKNYQSMLPNYLNQGQYQIGNRSIDIRSIWTNENLFKNIINQVNINRINESENVIVFENRNPLPYIYASVDPVMIEGNLDEMLKVLEFTPSLTKHVLFLSEQLGSEQLSSIPMNMGSIPLQSTSITTCDDIIDWTPVYGSISFLTDIHDKQEGNASLQAYGASDVHGNFRFMYNPLGTWDLKECTRLGLWVKANSTGWSRQRVIVRDVNGNARAWDFSIPTDQWTELVLPFETYNYQDEGFNSGSVNRVEVTFEDPAKNNTNLAVNLDAIHFYSLELFERKPLLSITTIESNESWTPMYGNISLLVDAQDKQEGNASLQGYGTSDANGNFRFIYNPPGTWDFTNETYLALWLKINPAGWSCQRVIIRDANGLARAWDFSIPPDQWTDLSFPLNSYNYEDKGFNMSAVDRIEITAEDGAKTNTEMTIKVDDIRLEVLEPKIRPTSNDNVNNKTTCTFTKENPTKYTVHVNASEPFFLIFSESYNANWAAYINGEEIKDHFMANGYANAWYINKTGSFDITLEFWPQRLFSIGVAISLATLTFSVLYISQDKIKILYRQYTKKRKPQPK